MNYSDLLANAARSCDKTVTFDFAGYVVQFDTNSAPLVAELLDYFKHFLADNGASPDCQVRGLQSDTPDIAGDWIVKQPDPGKTKIKEHILRDGDSHIVRKVLTGVHLFFVGNERLCAGPLEANPNQVVNFINNMVLEHQLEAGGQLFHASGVASGGAGLGMAGQSGKGKSTLALRLLQRGKLDLVSNDRLVVDTEPGFLQMRGIAKYPRINPGTIIHQPELIDMVSADNLARYRAMAPDELWQLEEKYDAFVEPAFGSAFQLQAKMDLFVALDWDRTLDAPTTLTRADPDDHPALVETVMKSPGIMLPKASARIPEAVVGPYIELLRRCDFYILGGGVDFDGAADQIVAILDRN